MHYLLHKPLLLNCTLMCTSLQKAWNAMLCCKSPHQEVAGADAVVRQRVVWPTLRKLECLCKHALVDTATAGVDATFVTTRMTFHHQALQRRIAADQRYRLCYRLSHTIACCQDAWLHCYPAVKGHKTGQCKCEIP